MRNLFPVVFDNIYEAQRHIRQFELHYIAAQSATRQSPFPGGFPDFFVMAGANCPDSHFIMTRLQFRDEDVRFFKILSKETSYPYLTDFRRFSLKPNLYNKRFLYRGQREDYGSIKPSLFRDENKRYFLDDLIKVQELQALIAQHPLVQLLGINGFEIGHWDVKLQCNLYGLAQHYYNKSTMVDFSSSLDVASFFAVTKNVNDRYYPADLDSGDVGVIYMLEIDSSLAYNRVHGLDVTSIGKQFGFMRPERQLGFLVEGLTNHDLSKSNRLTPVYFRHNRAIAEEIYARWDEGRSIAPEDSLERYWLSYRDNQQPFEISNKAIELNLAFNPKETWDSITQKILDIKTEDGKPMFKLSGKEWPELPQSMLDDYYQDILNGWWQDLFCANIQFPEFYIGRKKREAFLNLPNDERYRKAFRN